MAEVLADRLYRYTSLPSALDILMRRRLTLLDPSTWPDENDKGYLFAYKRVKKLKALRALCFTSTYETSQHWELFAGGGSGVRLTFRRSLLMQDISSISGVQLKDVVYREIKKAQLNASDVDMWPFLKRYPYEGEKEVRLIHESAESALSPEIALSEKTLERLTFHPATPKALMDTMKSLVADLLGDPDFEVGRSTMFKSKTWLNPVEKAADRLLKE